MRMRSAPLGVEVDEEGPSAVFSAASVVVVVVVYGSAVVVKAHAPRGCCRRCQGRRDFAN